jgi:hypothetical protein
MTLLEVVDAAGAEFYRVFSEAHDLVNTRLVQANGFTQQLPSGVVSHAITELAKTMLLEIEGVTRAAGPRDEFLLAVGNEHYRFRVNRSRLRGAATLKGHTAADLTSPTGNAVSVNADNRFFLLLWVAERGEFGGVWVVNPAAMPEVIEGTQFTTYKKVDGQLWSEALMIPQPAMVDLNIHVPPVDRKVEIGQRRPAAGGAAEQAG